MLLVSNLYAHVFNVEQLRDRAEFDTKVRALGLVQPEWTKGDRIKEAEPGQEDAEGLSLSLSDTHTNTHTHTHTHTHTGEDAVDEEELARLEGELYGVDPSTLSAASPHDFEKDDDDNFHIDFLTIASNLRAVRAAAVHCPRSQSFFHTKRRQCTFPFPSHLLILT